MKKIILTILIIIPFSLNANENAKEKKVAKYVMENIQRDYVNCYSVYKVAAQSFKDAGKDKNITTHEVLMKNGMIISEISGFPTFYTQLIFDTFDKTIKIKSVLRDTESIRILSNCEKLIKYKLES